MNRFQKIISGFFVCLFLSFFALSLPVNAAAFAGTADLFGGEEANINANIGITTAAPQVIIARLINITLGLVGTIFLVLVVYGGFLWMTSAGDPAKIEKAKKLLVAAVIGMILTLSSWGIARYIINKLNGAIGPGSVSCTVGDVLPCACGTKTCDATGSWDMSGCTPCGAGVLGANCDGIVASPACDPGGVCIPGLVCDNATATSSCTCILPVGGFGAACNGTTTPAVCEPVPSKCNPLLICPDSGADACTCIGAPVIDWVSPKNAAGNPVGTSTNFLTIGGRFFGTTTGEVRFFDGATTSIVADFPNTVNAACGNTWTQNEIIVIIPAGAQDGPIQVVRADLQQDTTNDTRGNPIPDFQNDNLIRPGLCSTKNTTLGSPCVGSACGYFNEGLNLQGIHFNGAARTILIGGSTGSTSASTIVWGGTNLFADALVPDLVPAKTRIFLRVDGRYSNEMNFEVFQNNSRRPRIDYIDPGTGRRGDYITIYGSNFGAKPGQVTFNPGGFPADVAFPKGCENYWHDTYIVAKVPPLAAIAPNQVTVTTAAPAQTSDPADFTVAAGLPGPGVCSMKPRNGEVGQVVDLIGERFGTWGGSSATEFFNVAQSTTTASTNWNPGNNGKIKTDVPTGAETGPFVVINSAGTKSNSLNFMVGKCTADSQCDVPGGEKCCAGGTKDGLCDTDCGSAGATTSNVFGWSFSTGSTTPPETCAGNKTAAQCLSSATCPNSPGQCQMTTVGQVGKCGDVECNAINSVCAGACTYDAALDKCKNPLATCTMASTTMITGFTSSCVRVSGNNILQVDAGVASCPLGTFKDTNGRCSVGNLGNPTACNLCSAGFACESGECVINRDVCPTGSTCNIGLGMCENPADDCECCCRTANSEQDCCPGLTCVAGGCGAGAPDYGQCQNCRVEIDGVLGSTTPQEQALSDQACSCTPGSSRRCDFVVGNAADTGTCVDTSGINGPCDEENPDTPVCVDPQDWNCAPGLTCVLAGQPNECTCQPAAPVVNMPCDSDTTTPTCEPTDPDVMMCPDPPNQICDPTTCTCVSNAGAGALCQDAANPACSVGVDACAPDYACIEDGAATDCRCCCTPGGPANAAGLECVADIAPCSTAARGLFCGCTNDAQCGNPTIDACGNDTCCRVRPTVATTTPGTNQTSVCRNPLIQVKFDQPMNPASFSGNVILVGDYGASLCPANTNFLTSVPRQGSLLARTWNKIKTFFGGTATALVGNFCAVTGTTAGYNEQVSGNGVLTFAPNQLLDPLRDYYVVIKGDSSSTDGVLEGVLSKYGIAMDGTQAITTVGLNSVDYHGYNWMFTTKPSSPLDNGVCKFDKIVLDPPSYVFSLTSTSTRNNLAGATTTIMAYSETSNGTRVVPIPALYDWNWTWLSEDQTVVTVSNSNNPLQIITAGNKKDARTYVDVQSKILNDTLNLPSTKNQTKTAKALIRVFFCANPWPPISNVVTWPWQDASGNCSAGLGGAGCDNYNFEFYYCRDSEKGNTPALPSIQNSSTTPIRGYYNNILKEYFFLRAATPLVAGGLTATTTATGGQVVLTWFTSGSSGYKVYYGTQPGKYDFTLDRGNSNNALISNLTNGKKYYFTIKAYEDAAGGTAAESAYWGEVSAIPLDTTAPAMPGFRSATGLRVSSNNDTLTWTANTDDTAKYKVYLGSKTGFYGQSFEVGKSTQATLSGLRSDQVYYVTVTAIDASGNESPKTYTDQSGAVRNYEIIVHKNIQVLKDLKAIKDALDAYKVATGLYPLGSGPARFDGYCSSWGSDLGLGWIPALNVAPYFPAGLPIDPGVPAGFVCDGAANPANPNIGQARQESKQYYYRSDTGSDYKLLSHSPEDMNVAADMIDPLRKGWAFGYWTEAAKNTY